MYAFQRISDNRWLARLDNLAVPPTEVDHIAMVATEYAIPANNIRRIDTVADPRVDPLTPPPRPQTADEVELTQIRALYQACSGGTATNAQILQLLGLMGKRIFK